MNTQRLIDFIKSVSVRLVLIVLALILVLIVASRNVEFNLEQELLTNQTQTETTGKLR